MKKFCLSAMPFAAELLKQTHDILLNLGAGGL